jgi:hypothetical protein
LLSNSSPTKRPRLVCRRRPQLVAAFVGRFRSTWQGKDAGVTSTCSDKVRVVDTAVRTVDV